MSAFRKLKKRTVFIITGVVLFFLFVILLVAAVILPRMASYLVVSDVPEKSDAIVVLSGSVPDRVLEAAELFKQGLSQRIILLRMELSTSHRYVEENLGIDLPDDIEVNRAILKKLGVPEKNIIAVENNESGTEREAEFVRPILENIKDDRRDAYHHLMILVVTSKYHTRRAKLIFRSILGKEVEVRVIPTRYDDSNPSGWWKRRRDARQVVVEYQKLIAFMF